MRISTREGADSDGDGVHDGISCHACPLLWLDGKVDMVVMIMIMMLIWWHSLSCLLSLLFEDRVSFCLA